MMLMSPLPLLMSAPYLGRGDGAVSASSAVENYNPESEPSRPHRQVAHVGVVGSACQTGLGRQTEGGGGWGVVLNALPRLG